MTSKGALHNENYITFFTSGSTGTPKKITRTLKQLVCEIETFEQMFGGIMGDSVIYSTVSHQHIYGLLFTILWPLHTGRRLNQTPLNYPEQIIEVINNSSSPLTLISSPAILKRLHNLKSKQRTITIFSSGGMLEKTDADQVNDSLGSYPIEVLGSTETSGVAYRQQKLPDNNSWQPLPGVELSLEPNDNCLVVRSPFFDSDDGFTMGDMAQIHQDGRFDLLGRADRIVKIEEKRVSLAEIEKRLTQSEFVAEAYALKLESHRQYIGSIITLTRKGQESLEKNGKLWLNNCLKIMLSEHIERLLVPKQFRYVEKIPTNSQGKFVLVELKQLFEHRHEKP